MSRFWNRPGYLLSYFWNTLVAVSDAVVLVSVVQLLRKDRLHLGSGWHFLRHFLGKVTSFTLTHPPVSMQQIVKTKHLQPPRNNNKFNFSHTCSTVSNFF